MSCLSSYQPSTLSYKYAIHCLGLLQMSLVADLSCPDPAFSDWTDRRASRGSHCGGPAAQPGRPSEHEAAEKRGEGVKVNTQIDYCTKNVHYTHTCTYTCRFEKTTPFFFKYR